MGLCCESTLRPEWKSGGGRFKKKTGSRGVTARIRSVNATIGQIAMLRKKRNDRRVLNMVHT